MNIIKKEYKKNGIIITFESGNIIFVKNEKDLKNRLTELRD